MFSCSHGRDNRCDCHNEGYAVKGKELRDGEVEVCIYRRLNAGWFDVRCEAFAHAPAMGKFAKLLSRQFQGFALAMEAVDSDFLFPTLSNPETNRTTKACIGMTYDAND